MVFGLMSRADYEAARPSDAAYPKVTGAVVSELRFRGYDATGPGLEYMVKRGAINAPEIEGKSRVWSAADVDAAADILAREDKLSPKGSYHNYEATDPLDDERALEACYAEHPAVPRHELVRVVIPGVPDRGIPGLIKYRPMTQKELHERHCWIQARIVTKAPPGGAA